MSHRIANAFERVIAALGPHGATIAPRPGLADASELEAAIGTPLPDDYKAWLALHDGEDNVGGRVDFLPTGETHLLSASETLARYRDQREWFQSDDDPGFAQFNDDDRIRNVVSHARRVMIASNAWGDGDNMVLDLCPGPKGAVGQVIVATSECDFEVVGESFGDFLRRLATALEDGLLVVHEGKGAAHVVERGTEYGRWEHVLRGVVPR
jgi:cell wall assembly regulator SMI1